jgi:hypothetical protein
LLRASKGAVGLAADDVDADADVDDADADAEVEAAPELEAKVDPSARVRVPSGARRTVAATPLFSSVRRGGGGGM